MTAEADELYTISPAQLASYDRDGYLILHDALTPLAATQLQQWSRDVHSWPNVPGKHMAYTETLRDGTTGTCRTENFANLYVCMSQNASRRVEADRPAKVMMALINGLGDEG